MLKVERGERLVLKPSTFDIKHPSKPMLERFFKLSERNASVKTEVLAGLTTFMTMAYIIFVNPAILSQAGVPFEDATTATCLTAGIITIVMGLYANYPFALAAGMGMNAFVAFTVASAAIGLGSWQAAMTVIFLEGIIITILVLTRVREWVMDAIPDSLKRAIGVGIGLFIALIGLSQGRVVEANPVTLVTFADPINIVAAITLTGLFVTAALMVLRIRAAFLARYILCSYRFYGWEGDNSSRFANHLLSSDSSCPYNCWLPDDYGSQRYPL
jgi:AGZA family xanthine/uracil permease-like MFS transporter